MNEQMKECYQKVKKTTALTTKNFGTGLYGFNSCFINKYNQANVYNDNICVAFCMNDIYGYPRSYRNSPSQ
jgi:hypothetical protein